MHKICPASLAGPEEWAYDSPEEYVDESEEPVDLEYMGLTLLWYGPKRITWTPCRMTSVDEVKALVAYASLNGAPDLLEAIAEGGDLTESRAFGDCLPDSEREAIREAVIEQVRKSGEWRNG